LTGPFSETNTCGTSLAAGATCSVSVKFAPTTAGAATGTLSVNSSAPGSPLTVALSGTGVATTTTNLALGAAVTASSYTQTYVPANVVDGNTSTYKRQPVPVALPRRYCGGPWRGGRGMNPLVLAA
jgi:hypothetical protein